MTITKIIFSKQVVFEDEEIDLLIIKRTVN